MSVVSVLKIALTEPSGRIRIGDDEGLHVTRRDANSANGQPGSHGLHPIPRTSPRSDRQSRDIGTTEDSPMIAAIYEAHLSITKMRAAFAELRGDHGGDDIG